MTLSEYEKDPNHITTDFIKYYYSKLSSDSSKLYQLYAKDAVLKHMDHNLDPFKGISTDYQGIENITKYWKARPELSGSKLVILTVNTIQNSDNTLVTTVIGELLLKEDYENIDQIEPTRLFTQTFILEPHSKKDNFDIKSDILTFIPDTDFMEIQLEDHVINEVQNENEIETETESKIHEEKSLVESSVASNGTTSNNVKKQQPNGKKSDSKDTIQQEVVEKTSSPSITSTTTKTNNTTNGSADVEAKNITKGKVSTNAVTEEKVVTRTTPPSSSISAGSSATISEPPTSSTVATSVPSASVSNTVETKSSSDKTEPSTTSPASKASIQSSSAAETKAKEVSANSVKSEKHINNTPTTATPSSTTSKSEVSSKSKSSSSPPPSSEPSTSTATTTSASSTAIPPKEVKTAPPVPSSWASALKSSNNKVTSPALTQSSTGLQQSPRSTATPLSPPVSEANTNDTTASSTTSNTNNNAGSNNQHKFEIFVNFKQTPNPVDEKDLRTAFNGENFKNYTVQMSKTNTAVVGFLTQEEQMRALEVGKIFYPKTKTNFGIDKREKRPPNRKKTNGFKNSNSKRN